MTAPAWKGPTVTGICRECGHVETIKDRDVLRNSHDGRGYCTECGQLVEWNVWDGPVMPRG